MSSTHVTVKPTELLFKYQFFYSNPLNMSLENVLDTLPGDKSRMVLEIIESLVNKTLDKDMQGFSEENVFGILTKEQQARLVEQSIFQIAKSKILYILYTHVV
ncbi:hypothetical protein MHBO_004102 [Bonamia ostreae]|uniref:Uncharacterized protein n=1 Tax=Bonamia ostreae TaxID=126728 RepID=A0ABV2ASE8_9EUKA